MKKPILVVALFLASTRLFAALPAEQDLLVTSKQQANIFRDQVEPFQLDVNFRAQLMKPMDGHVTWKFKAKDCWWRRIAMDGFEQIDIRNGDTIYTIRNVAFTPIRVRELLDLLQFPEVPEGLLVKKLKQRVENGTAITCIQTETKLPARMRHDVCLDSASHEILSETSFQAVDEQHKKQFSGYIEFAGHRYPRKLELRVNGSAAITANVQSLKTAAFDDTLLAVPNGAIERRQCANMHHPVAIETPDPDYPLSASARRISGDTTVFLTVFTDGSVGNIQLIGTATQELDDTTLRTLRTWKFKSAMCGTEPIVSDIQVVMSFRLQ